MNMKRNVSLLKWAFTLLVFVSLFVPLCALSEEIIIDDKLPPEERLNIRLLLMQGDTVHILQKSSTCEDVENDPEFYPIYTYYHRCYALQPDNTVVPCDKHCETIFDNGIGSISCSPDGNTYLIDAQYRLYQWTPDADSPWKMLITLDTSGLVLDRYESTTYDGFFVQDNHAYVRAENEFGTTATLYEYDCTTAERREISTLPKIGGVHPSDVPGKLYVQASRGGSYLLDYLMDIKTGKIEMINLGVSEMRTAVAVKEGGWYIYGNISVFEGTTEGEMKKLFTHSGRTCWNIVLDSRGEKLYALDTADRLVVYPVKQQTETHQLRVAGDLWGLREEKNCIPRLSEFSKTHGEIELLQAPNTDTFHKIAQAMLLKDDSFDMMMLSVSQSDLEAMFSKGYYTDLTGINGVEAYMDKVLPVYREHCLWDGKIVALPIMADNRAMLRNEELWETLQIPMVPETWDAFFDCIAWLDAEGLLEEYPLFADNGSRYPDAYNRIRLNLLDAYCASSARKGGVFTWKNAELQRLLERLVELKDAIQRNDAHTFVEDGFFYPEASTSSLVGTYKGVSYGVGYSDAYVPMHLAMAEGETPSLTTRLDVLVINPYSKNIDLVTQLCSYIVKNHTPYQRCVFLQEGREGIYDDEFAPWVEDWQKRLDEIEAAEAALDPNDEEGRIAWQEQREMLQFNRNVREEVYWNVTSKSAEWYHASIPALWVKTKKFTDISNYGEKAMQDFTEGTTSPGELLNSLENLLLTMRLEAQ